MEGKTLRFNTDKNEVLISWPMFDVLQKSGKYPCVLRCHHGLHILWLFFKFFSTRYACGISGAFRPDPAFMCKHCNRLAIPVDGRAVTEFTVRRHNLEVELHFWYLVDCLISGGGREFASIKIYRVPQGAISTTPCPSSPTANSPSPPKAEFIILASGPPCTAQMKPVSPNHLICIAYNAMTGQWSGGCVVTSQTRLYHND